MMIKTSYATGLKVLLLVIFFSSYYYVSSTQVGAKEIERNRYYNYVSKVEYKQEDKVTYLTFDDGPSINTIKILDILDKYGIKATFFVVGKNVEAHPQILREIVRKGHMIGVHCYNHDYSEIYSSAEAYMEDFFKAYNTIKEVSGIQPYIFRFPGGSVNNYNNNTREEIFEEMGRRGFIFYDWNSSSEDAVVGAVAVSCINSVISTSQSKHNILLCHDTKDVTALNLEAYIKELNKKGYRYFDTLEGVPPVHF
ncbi:polysaccharide deacetylase family protein [Alloiococcus sp. CFN-8]|uniref:polysaccharide deacetylase family protein n=1 Tax=Alloiococcus sp. CFN-8 TaxID=3416081 RepID=UPI003CF7B9F5